MRQTCFPPDWNACPKSEQYSRATTGCTLSIRTSKLFQIPVARARVYNANTQLIDRVGIHARPMLRPVHLFVKLRVGNRAHANKALFSSLKKPKTFQVFPSHRILRHMHGALNIDKNKN